MPAELILQRTPNAAALLAEREQLATVRTTLAERASELSEIRARLKAFEGRLPSPSWILYAELDDVELASPSARSISTIRLRAPPGRGSSPAREEDP